MIEFLKQLNLPTTLNELGLEDANIKQLEFACDFACKNESDIHKLPFNVNTQMLLEALIVGQEDNYYSKCPLN